MQPGEVVDGRLYLRVPIEAKEAKRLVRGRWDPLRRNGVARWLPDG